MCPTYGTTKISSFGSVSSVLWSMINISRTVIQQMKDIPQVFQQWHVSFGATWGPRSTQRYNRNSRWTISGVLSLPRFRTWFPLIPQTYEPRSGSFAARIYSPRSPECYSLKGLRIGMEHNGEIVLNTLESQCNLFPFSTHFKIVNDICSIDLLPRAVSIEVAPSG